MTKKLLMKMNKMSLRKSRNKEMIENGEEERAYQKYVEKY